MLNKFIIMVCVTLFLFHLNLLAEDSQKVYLSQTYVDTAVQNAYFGFLSSAEGANGERQSVAIKHAKEVVAKLKSLATDDPNSRYILWRVGELEQQIYLEEEEVMLKLMYKRQKAVNLLVVKFNAETGKKRPNFANLVAIQHRMSELQPKKGNELAYLIRDRDKNISREVIYSIERAFISSNYEKAKKEFAYVTKNKKNLFISGAKYASFEKRIRDKDNADYILNNIGRNMQKMNAIAESANIIEAKRYVSIFKRDFEGAKKFLPSKKISIFSKQISAVSKKISNKEDSLVAVNLQILKSRGSDIAIDYMDNVLRKKGVSNDKILMVDSAIMSQPSKNSSASNSAVDSDILSLTADDGGLGFTFGDVRARAQEKADSIKIYELEQKEIARKEYAKTHKKEIKAAKKAEKKLAKNREKATAYVIQIYDYLDAGEVSSARDLFIKYNNQLEMYSGKDIFDMLKLTVEQSYEDNKKSKTPTISAEIKQASASSSAVDISAYENYDNVSAKSVDSVTTTIMKIYTLLEQNNESGALNLFQQNLQLIKTHSSEAVFTALEFTVNSAMQGQ